MAFLLLLGVELRTYELLSVTLLQCFEIDIYFDIKSVTNMDAMIGESMLESISTDVVFEGVWTNVQDPVRQVIIKTNT